MRIVAISDTHSRNPFKWQIPEGDVLIHAGDGTAVGSEEQLEQLGRWLGRLPHARKLYVPGNHDRIFLTTPLTAKGILLAHGVEVLVDREVEVGGINFWGFPWLQYNFGFLPFEATDIAERAELIPAGIDVLISHSPPFGILDWSPMLGGNSIGSSALANAIFYRVHPRVHIFGHCHYAYGRVPPNGAVVTEFLNAALCDDENRPVLTRHPWVVDILPGSSVGRAIAC